MYSMLMLVFLCTINSVIGQKYIDKVELLTGGAVDVFHIEPKEEKNSVGNPISSFYLSGIVSLKLNESTFIESGLTWKTYANGFEISRGLADAIGSPSVGTYTNPINTFQVPLRYVSFTSDKFLKKIKFFGGVGIRLFIANIEKRRIIASRHNYFSFSSATHNNSFVLFELLGGFSVSLSDKMRLNFRGEYVDGLTDFIVTDVSYLNGGIRSFKRVSRGGFIGVGIGVSYYLN